MSDCFPGSVSGRLIFTLLKINCCKIQLNTLQTRAITLLLCSKPQFCNTTKNKTKQNIFLEHGKCFEKKYRFESNNNTTVTPFAFTVEPQAFLNKTVSSVERNREFGYFHIEETFTWAKFDTPTIYKNIEQ